MHAGLLVGVGETVVLVGVLCETVALVVVDGFVELGPDALGGDGCCDPHAVRPAQAIARMAINRIAFDINVLPEPVDGAAFAIGAPAIPIAIAPAMSNPRTMFV